MRKQSLERRIKCPGRFSQLREELHNEAVDVVLERHSGMVSREELSAVWELMEDYILQFDLKDPYYFSDQNKGEGIHARKAPVENYQSLIPLFPSTFSFSDELWIEYAADQGNSPKIGDYLVKMAHTPKKFFQTELERNPSDIHLSCKGNLANYIISANVGIGTASEGGTLGGGIRSDSPFIFEVYKVEGPGYDKSGTGHEKNLAGVIGWWANNDTMLISQLQSCKNARLPEGCHFGYTLFQIAKTAAITMGFDVIASYSARSHPMFAERSGSKTQLLPDFVKIWDIGARKSGLDPTSGRNGFYFKQLKKTSQLRLPFLD